MRTIEQRAEDYQTRIESRNPSAEAWDFEGAYRRGAYDQRAIDIEKASRLYCKLHGVKGCNAFDECKIIIDLRKEMESE